MAGQATVEARAPEPLWAATIVCQLCRRATPYLVHHSPLPPPAQLRALPALQHPPGGNSLQAGAGALRAETAARWEAHPFFGQLLRAGFFLRSADRMRGRSALPHGSVFLAWAVEQ